MFFISFAGNAGQILYGRCCRNEKIQAFYKRTSSSLAERWPRGFWYPTITSWRLLKKFCKSCSCFASLRASSPVCASEVSVTRTRERGAGVSLPLPCSRLHRSLARSRETRFTRPNRRACSQTTVLLYRLVPLAKPKWKTASAKLSCSLQLALFSKTNKCIGKKKLFMIFIFDRNTRWPMFSL